MPKKSQDAFLQFLKKKRKEVSKKQVREERDLQAPIHRAYAEQTKRGRSWHSLGGVLAGGILLLILLTGLLFFLLVKERNKSAELVSAVSQTEKELASIAEEVPRQTIRNTQDSLVEAQKKLRLALGDTNIGEPKAVPAPEKKPTASPEEKDTPPKPQPVPEEKSATLPPPVPEKPAASAPASSEKPEKRVAALSTPAGQTLFPFVFIDSGEKVLLVEKNTRTLFLLRSVQGKLALVKAYPCIVGKNIKDKEKTGDMATPEGIYFLVQFIPATKLPENYGMGAFVLNYPDFLDKKEGKTGDGVWLHGHEPKKKLDEVQSTKGCVVVDNESMRELSTLIKLGTTPMVIVDQLAFRSADSQKKIAQDLIGFTNAWQKSWESVDMKKFVRFYSSDFKSADGVDLETFAQRKEKVSKKKDFIRIRLDRKAVLLPQKYQGDIAVIRFRQTYRSSNFNSMSVKSLYLKKGQKGWQIIGESLLPS